MKNLNLEIFKTVVEKKEIKSILNPDNALLDEVIITEDRVIGVFRPRRKDHQGYFSEKLKFPNLFSILMAAQLLIVYSKKKLEIQETQFFLKSYGAKTIMFSPPLGVVKIEVCTDNLNIKSIEGSNGKGVEISGFTLDVKSEDERLVEIITSIVLIAY